MGARQHATWLPWSSGLEDLQFIAQLENDVQEKSAQIMKSWANAVGIRGFWPILHPLASCEFWQRNPSYIKAHGCEIQVVG